MENKYAFDIPIVFCTFNRLDCAKKVFEKIREIKPKKLYLVSDGPRMGIAEEQEKVNAVRKHLESHIDWECLVYKNFADANMGCGKRMSDGITWAFEKEEKLIILEDDCLVDISFFRYCKELLDLYEHDENIMLIGGYNPLGVVKNFGSFLFTPFAEIWGWATWKRVWQQYDYDIVAWKERNITSYMKKIMNTTMIEYYSNMFDQVYTHELDTWDYQLQYLIFQKEGLSIVPCKNMVKNIGFGVDATHTKDTLEQVCNVAHVMDFPLHVPKKIESNKQYNRKMLRTLYGKNSLIKIVKRFLHLNPNESIFRKRSQ